MCQGVDEFKEVKFKWRRIVDKFPFHHSRSSVDIKAPPPSPPHTLLRPSYQPPTSHTRVPLARAAPLCTQDKWRNICKKRAATLTSANSLTDAALAAQGFCTCTVANGGTRSGTRSGRSSGRSSGPCLNKYVTSTCVAVPGAAAASWDRAGWLRGDDGTAQCGGASDGYGYGYGYGTVPGD